MKYKVQHGVMDLIDAPVSSLLQVEQDNRPVSPLVQLGRGDLILKLKNEALDIKADNILLVSECGNRVRVSLANAEVSLQNK